MSNDWSSGLVGRVVRYTLDPEDKAQTAEGICVGAWLEQPTPESVPEGPGGLAVAILLTGERRAGGGSWAHARPVVIRFLSWDHMDDLGATLEVLT